MENRLKGLKKIMNEKTFSQVKFTEKHRQTIQNKIHNQGNKEDIILSILQLLSQEKTGYQLTNLLSGRGIRHFDDNEGALYILLHSLENKGVLQSSWIAKEEAKYYQLTNKGKKLLKQSEKKESRSHVILRQLVGGVEWKIAESHS
ncbi:PadR family transcriptional regulator [Fictibacillus sp. b24]|uniref:PadR family transcriptional regulator n=1 Tax=Fictibacillus sp. b24 TaxID=3055863 RepID=UPI0025A129DB|nr:PadR family transcriptional regulator [Fictibacillus sp. b24]MDM5317403.1 PadR family transcriptional regulator [Fictibacillus sp. b24]